MEGGLRTGRLPKAPELSLQSFPSEWSWVWTYPLFHKLAAFACHASQGKRQAESTRAHGSSGSQPGTALYSLPKKAHGKLGEIKSVVLPRDLYFLPLSMVQVINHGSKNNFRSLDDWQNITFKYLKEIQQRRKSECPEEGGCGVPGRGGPQEGRGWEREGKEEKRPCVQEHLNLPDSSLPILGH